MSVQHDRSDDVRPRRRLTAGWTKLAVAAAAVVVTAGLAVGAERGGVFSTKDVSYQEKHAETEGSPSASTTQPQPTASQLGKAAVQSLPGEAIGGVTGQSGRGSGHGDSPKGGAVLGPVAVAAVTAVAALPTSEALALVAGAGVPVVGVPVKAYTWNDRNGRNSALITHELVKDRHGKVVKDLLHVVVVAQLGKTLKQVGRFIDHTTGLDLDLFQLHDRDHDGIAEIVICFVTKVVGKLTPVTLIVHRLVGGHDYVLRGTGLPEQTVAGLNPTELLAVPTALLSPVLSAVPAAAAWPQGDYADSLNVVNTFLH